MRLFMCLLTDASSFERDNWLISIINYLKTIMMMAMVIRRYTERKIGHAVKDVL